MTHKGIEYTVTNDPPNGWKQTVDGQVIGWAHTEAAADQECKTYIIRLIEWQKENKQ